MTYGRKTNVGQGDSVGSLMAFPEPESEAPRKTQTLFSQRQIQNGITPAVAGVTKIDQKLSDTEALIKKQEEEIAKMQMRTTGQS